MGDVDNWGGYAVWARNTCDISISSSQFFREYKIALNKVFNKKYLGFIDNEIGKNNNITSNELIEKLKRYLDNQSILDPSYKKSLT